MGRDEIDAILDPLNDDELLIAMPKIIKNLEAENQRLKKGIQDGIKRIKKDYTIDHSGFFEQLLDGEKVV